MEKDITLQLSRDELLKIISGLKLLKASKSKWLNDETEQRLYVIKSLELSINELNLLIKNLNKEL
jgi:hypothetical protein